MFNPSERNPRPSSGVVAKPEFIRISDAVRTFALSRSAIYELIQAGAIRSVSLRKRGNLRGVRLIDYASLAAYLHAQATGGAQ